MPFTTTSPSTGGSGNANTGDITFNGVKIIGAGTASGDGSNNGTIELVPDSTHGTDQYLIIDPTAPNHIHIRGGGTQDASQAQLILGGERNNVALSDGGRNVSISTRPATVINTYTNLNQTGNTSFVVSNTANIYIGDTVYYAGGGDIVTVDSVTPDSPIAGQQTITANLNGTPALFVAGGAHIFSHEEEWNNYWEFRSDGYLTGPAMGGLFVNGINGQQQYPLYVNSNKSVVISGTEGEFLNNEAIPANQIATLGDISTGEVTYAVQGATNGTQPTFNGTPLFTGSYVKTGPMVYFRIYVDMSNITSFGTGVYYVTLPFNTKHEIYVRDGHVADFSTSKKYSISGSALAGTNQLYLTTTVAGGEEVNFSPTVPFTLAPEDSFHIAGTFIAQ